MTLPNDNPLSSLVLRGSQFGLPLISKGQIDTMKNSLSNPTHTQRFYGERRFSFVREGKKKSDGEASRSTIALMSLAQESQFLLHSWCASSEITTLLHVLTEPTLGKVHDVLSCVLSTNPLFTFDHCTRICSQIIHQMTHAAQFISAHGYIVLEPSYEEVQVVKFNVSRAYLHVKFSSFEKCILHKHFSCNYETLMDPTPGHISLHPSAAATTPGKDPAKLIPHISAHYWLCEFASLSLFPHVYFGEKAVYEQTRVRCFSILGDWLNGRPIWLLDTMCTRMFAAAVRLLREVQEVFASANSEDGGVDGADTLPRYFERFLEVVGADAEMCLKEPHPCPSDVTLLPSTAFRELLHSQSSLFPHVATHPSTPHATALFLALDGARTGDPCAISFLVDLAHEEVSRILIGQEAGDVPYNNTCYSVCAPPFSYYIWKGLGSADQSTRGEAAAVLQMLHSTGVSFIDAHSGHPALLFPSNLPAASLCAKVTMGPANEKASSGGHVTGSQPSGSEAPPHRPIVFNGARKEQVEATCRSVERLVSRMVGEADPYWGKIVDFIKGGLYGTLWGTPKSTQNSVIISACAPLVKRNPRYRKHGLDSGEFEVRAPEVAAVGWACEFASKAALSVYREMQQSYESKGGSIDELAEIARTGFGWAMKSVAYGNKDAENLGQEWVDASSWLVGKRDEKDGKTVDA